MTPYNNRNIINENQYGFMPRRSDEQLLKRVIKDIKNAWDAKQQVILVSFDIEGAFNSAWWPSIKTALKKHFADSEVLGIMNSYLDQREIIIEYGGILKTYQTNRRCV